MVPEAKRITNLFRGEHIVLADMRGMSVLAPEAAELFGEVIRYGRMHGAVLCVHLSDSSITRLQAARLARDLAARTLELERERLRFGRASNFEVLNFETNLRAADTQALTAQVGYLNALTSLDLQLGTTLDTWKISLND